MTCLATLVFSQVGIGTANPASGAILDVSSTDKGFLPPRLTTAQRDGIVSKPVGLTLYNTTENCLQYWNGSTWGCTDDGGGTSNPGTGTIDCTQVTFNGTYEEGKIMTSENTVVISVNVTSTGAWTASSDTLNGIKFEGYGEFLTTGVQNITLRALGTPTISGTFGYTFGLGSSTCKRDVIFSVSSTKVPPPNFTASCTGYRLPRKESGSEFVSVNGKGLYISYGPHFNLSQGYADASSCGVGMVGQANIYACGGLTGDSTISRFRFSRNVTNVKVTNQSLGSGDIIYFRLFRDGVLLNPTITYDPNIGCNSNLIVSQGGEVSANGPSGYVTMVYNIGGVWFDEMEIVGLNNSGGYGGSNISLCLGNAQ